MTATAESVLRSGHPWLYAESIREQSRDGTAGELAVVYDRQDRFLAIGLYDPDSPLRLRVLHVGKPAKIDANWWRTRLEQALERRAGQFDDLTTGYRWINGESDGWPGLVLDRYDRTLVVKLYTSAWLAHWATIQDLLLTALHPERLVLRLSRNIQENAWRQFGRREGQILYGPPLESPLIFLETGLQFEADVIRGQKTGFFLDQRENRQRVERFCAGGQVLNLFSFSAGFSLYAARGGARAVTDVDISGHALEAGRRNFSLNRDQPAVDACRREMVQADAFEWLENARADYDVIILDPPSLAKKEMERPRALHAYGRLAELAIPRLREGGVLLAASCSAHVSAPEFFQTIRNRALAAQRPYTELRTTLQPLDHPATFPEAAYLKAIYLRFR